MRRLLYLALPLVLLALTGLVFVRVTNSGAYVARCICMEIHVGLARDQVRRTMADFPGLIDDAGPVDTWNIGDDYVLGVGYENDRVISWTFQAIREESLIDMILEWLGYPKAQRFQDSG
jgi:hypothetical protein